VLPWWLEKVLGLDVRSPDAETRPRPLLKTSRRSLEAHADGVASAVLARLVERGYAELSLAQRPAWLVATYDLAVRNSGHAGYFATHGVGRAAEAREALGALSLEVARAILDEAIKRHVSVPGETGARAVGFRRPEWSPPRYDDLDAEYAREAARVDRAVRDAVLARPADFLVVEG
jgi:hypothetical protein